MKLVPLTRFEDDERRWFQAGVEQGVFQFKTCIQSCPRLKEWKFSGSDEFITPSGGTRHLFNFQRNPENTCFLGREYIPHIAAVSRLIIEKNCDRTRYSFSSYQSFGRDLYSKKLGGSYETDAEFYDASNSLFLHLEAKKSRDDTEALARDIGSDTEFGAMKERHRKELEYVLDLVPRYLWLVGPGLIDPEEFVYEVQVDGLNATFTRIEKLPDHPC
jgi:hypothetical protein